MLSYLTHELPLKMKKINLILGITSCCLFINSCNNARTSGSTTIGSDDDSIVDVDSVYYDKLEKEDECDGLFTWYRYWVGNKVGALDKNKNILIPADYDGIGCDYDEHIFTVTDSDGNWGRYYLNGELFISSSRGYKGIMKVDISKGRYYYSVYDTENGTNGIVDKDGNEILPQKYNNIWHTEEYADEEIDSDYDINSFVIADGDDEWLMYIYIDDNGRIYRFPEPEWTRIYRSAKDYSQRIQVRKYTDYMYVGRRKFKASGYIDGNKVYSRNTKYDDGIYSESYYFNGNRLVFESDGYKRDFYLERDFSIDDYVPQRNNTYHDSYIGVDSQNEPSPDGYGNNNYYNESPLEYDQPIENAPNRYRCRACSQSGTCPVCNGSGQQLSELSIVTDDPVYKKCRHCKGTGRCPACGGDGWIDEGIDF